MMMAGKSEIYFLTSFQDFAAEGCWNSMQARSALPLTSSLKAASEVNSACQSADLCVTFGKHFNLSVFFLNDWEEMDWSTLTIQKPGILMMFILATHALAGSDGLQRDPAHSCRNILAFHPVLTIQT